MTQTTETSSEYWSLVSRLERAGGERFTDGREGNLYHEAADKLKWYYETYVSLEHD